MGKPKSSKSSIISAILIGLLFGVIASIAYFLISKLVILTLSKYDVITAFPLPYITLIVFILTTLITTLSVFFMRGNKHTLKEFSLYAISMLFVILLQETTVIFTYTNFMGFTTRFVVYWISFSMIPIIIVLLMLFITHKQKRIRLQNLLIYLLALLIVFAFMITTFGSLS